MNPEKLLSDKERRILRERVKALYLVGLSMCYLAGNFRFGLRGGERNIR